jgi:hypothetical protein
VPCDESTSQHGGPARTTTNIRRRQGRSTVARVARQSRSGTNRRTPGSPSAVFARSQTDRSRRRAVPYDIGHDMIVPATCRATVATVQRSDHGTAAFRSSSYALTMREDSSEMMER